MRVFITGAAGFIGRALRERYTAEGHEVSGCDMVADRETGIVAGDVGQPGEWQQALAGADLVIHTTASGKPMCGGRPTSSTPSSAPGPAGSSTSPR